MGASETRHNCTDRGTQRATPSVRVSERYGGSMVQAESGSGYSKGQIKSSAGGDKGFPCKSFWGTLDESPVAYRGPGSALR